MAVLLAAQRLAASLPLLPVEVAQRNVDPAHAVAVLHACAELLTAPLPHDDAEQLREARATLWRALAFVRAEVLAAEHYLRRGSDAPVVLGSACFLATMRVSAALADGLQPQLAARRVRDLAECTRAAAAPVALADRALNAFSCGEVTRALQVLRPVFAECVFSVDLVEYVEALEFRAAQLLTHTGNEAAFDDDTTRLLVAPGEFRAAPLLATLLWPCLVSMHHALIFARCAFEHNIDAPALDEAAAQRVRAELLALNEEHPCRERAPTLQRDFVAMFVQPGDRALHLLRNPGTTTSDVGLAGATLGDARMADVNRRSQLSPYECLRTQLAAAPRHESLELGLCLHDFLNALTVGVPGAEWERYYSRPKSALAANVEDVQQSAMEAPTLVQLFNHWQLAYRGRVFWYNSYVHSLVAWLLLLREQRTAPHSASAEYSAAARATVFDRLAAAAGNDAPAPPAAAPAPGSVAYTV